MYHFRRREGRSRRRHVEHFALVVVVDPKKDNKVYSINGKR